MNTIFEVLQVSAAGTIIISIVIITLQWLFIYTAVKSATKKAIIESFEEIKKIQDNPSKFKTAEEDFKEEMEEWS